MAAAFSTEKRKVFLVDDHPLVREWLANLINQQKDLFVCGEASRPVEALSAIGAAQPDVAIVDISLEDGSGLKLIQQIRAEQPKVAILVLSMHDEFIYAERALRLGARGYVMKREVTRKILQGIRAVLDGKLFVSETVARLFAEKMAGGHPTVTASPSDLLSDRELEVFLLLGRGLTNRQIAEELRIGLKTVQTYCARIKEELHLENHTALLHEAVRSYEKSNSS